VEVHIASFSDGLCEANIELSGPHRIYASEVSCYYMQSLWEYLVLGMVTRSHHMPTPGSDTSRVSKLKLSVRSS
jgi:hypothetical protein